MGGSCDRSGSSVAGVDARVSSASALGDSLVSAPGGSFAVGQHVEVAGLAARADLNGEVGEVLARNDALHTLLC